MTPSSVSTARHPGALVLINSSAPRASDFERYVKSYLDYFGVPYDVCDLASTQAPYDAGRYALIIVGHEGAVVGAPNLDAAGVGRLANAIEGGTGLVSFDPLLFAPSDSALSRWACATVGALSGGAASPTATTIEIHRGGLGEAITERHSDGETLSLFDEMAVPAFALSAGTNVLATAGEQPLLVAAADGHARALLWTSVAWMDSLVRGPLFGLDDLMWRGLAWAARKPFVLRGMPPTVTMRVDDVEGWGQQVGPSPFWWLEALRDHQIKPWLGLFINELSHHAITELKEYIADGAVTASVHGFTWHNFFYFDHWNRKPFSSARIAEHFALANAWYARHGDFPMSKIALGHFYEMSSPALEGLARWGMEYLGTFVEVDKHYTHLPYCTEPWLKAWPYRLHEEPRRANDTRWPIYYADFIPIPQAPEFDRRFFNCMIEIRDVAGYEWRPANDVPQTIERGALQLKRAFDSLAPGVLFTHEGDYIYFIEPDNWRAEIEGVAAAVADYNPTYVTMDEAYQYVRALRTSRVAGGAFDPVSGSLSITLSGRTDLPLKVGVFADDSLQPQWVEVAAFEGETTVQSAPEG